MSIAIDATQAAEPQAEAGKVRAMLSARTAGRMGLKLDRRGKRWEAAGG